MTEKLTHKKRGQLGRAKRRLNVKRRQKAFPAGLLAALNAKHITGDPNDCLRQITGVGIAGPPVNGSILSGTPTYVPWSLSPEILKADVELIAELKDVAEFRAGDPSAEPRHLAPLHVAVLTLRRLVGGAGMGLYSQAGKALTIQAERLADNKWVARLRVNMKQARDAAEGVGMR